MYGLLRWEALQDIQQVISLLEKAMAPHSSTLAWEIPWIDEPGGLQYMGLLRARHDWATSTFTFHFHALEKEMAAHSSVLAWRIPGTGEPGGLLSVGSHRVGHDCSNSSSSSSIRLQLTEVLQILRKATCMADGNLSAQVLVLNDAKSEGREEKPGNVTELKFSCSLLLSQHQEVSVSRKERCFIQKSGQSGQKVDLCPETNPEDSAQPWQLLKG